MEGVADRNGSFAFEGVPSGVWNLQAFPPYEAANYRGYRESDLSAVTLAEGETKQGITLSLYAANMTGRVMYLQSDGTLVPVNDARAYFYSDADGDGEPDMEGDESMDSGNATSDEEGFFGTSIGVGRARPPQRPQETLFPRLGGRPETYQLW